MEVDMSSRADPHAVRQAMVGSVEWMRDWQGVAPGAFARYAEDKGIRCCGSTKLTTEGSSQHYLRLKCPRCFTVLARYHLDKHEIVP